jgi:hypothetical protein
MLLIRKFLRLFLKRKMRSSSLKDSRNIIHQAILYLIYRKNSKLLARNISIKNSYDGKRCFIFFTGTSVANFDFDLLKDEPVIACGMSVVHREFKKLNVVSYFDPGSWEPRSLFYLDVVFSAVYRSTKKGCSVFLHSSAFPYRNQITSFREKDTYYLSSNGNYLSSHDIRSDLNDLNNIQESSITTALGIASHMGFKEIYLLGQDFLTDPPIYGHFYDGFNETGNPEDYKKYRERAAWMIEHVSNKGCKVINVIKDEKQKSCIDSITFDGLAKVLKS